MRQTLTSADEPFLHLRSLSLDYGEGAREPLHQHPWAQLLYAGFGSIQLKAANGIWLVPSGRAIIIPPKLPHQLQMLGRVELRTLYFSPQLNVQAAQVRALEVCPLLHELVLRICQLGALDSRNRRHQALLALIKTELADAPTAPIQLPLPTDARALRLTDRFADRATVGLSLNTLISQAGLSRRTAERLFQTETGLSPARWRRMFLLSQSFQALLAGKLLDDTWQAAGYKNPSAFSTAFRRHFGISPGTARRRGKTNYQATP